MECLVQLFHNFHQYQSWKVFLSRKYDKNIHDFLQDQDMVGLIPIKEVGTRIFTWMSSDVFKTQCYFLSAFYETFHTPYTAAVEASDKFVGKDDTIRMVGGYRMRIMPRLYASLICEAEHLLETYKAIGNDMKEGCGLDLGNLIML